MLEVIHLLQKGLQPLLLLLDEQHSRLGGGWDLVPEFGRDRRRNLHTADLRTPHLRASSARERFRPGGRRYHNQPADRQWEHRLWAGVRLSGGGPCGWGGRGTQGRHADRDRVVDDPSPSSVKRWGLLGR